MVRPRPDRPARGKRRRGECRGALADVGSPVRAPAPSRGRSCPASRHPKPQIRGRKRTPAGHAPGRCTPLPSVLFRRRHQTSSISSPPTAGCGSKLFHGKRGWHRSGRLPVAAQLLLAGAIVGGIAAPTRLAFKTSVSVRATPGRATAMPRLARLRPPGAVTLSFPPNSDSVCVRSGGARRRGAILSSCISTYAIALAVA